MKRIFSLAMGVVYLALMVAPVFAAEGVAVIKGTSTDSPISGEVKFKETEKGLTVEAKLKNVPNSRKLGFHIHENGSCDDMGKAAGGHYNPMSAPHGFLAKDGEHKAHAGDLGNIKIANDGTGTLKGFLPGISLRGGQYNVEGRAIILHEKQDDFGQPTGNAGGRIGCGIIKIEEIKRTYTCPMHPNVHQTSPGACSECGMELIEETK